MQQEPKGKNFNHTCLGVLGCFGGLFIHLVVGSLYQWGIINIYITSYYRLHDQTVNLENNSIAFPVMMLCIGLTMRLGLFFSEVTHPLIALSVTTLLQALAIFCSSYVMLMGGFIVLYGVVFGLLAGLNFMIPIVECNKYFPGHKMYVNGVILIGTGLGSLVFGLFSYFYLNPNKVPPNQGYYNGTPQLQAIARKVPSCLRYLSLLYLVIGFLGILMLSYVCIYNRNEQNRKREQSGQTNNKISQVVPIQQSKPALAAQAESSNVILPKSKDREVNDQGVELVDEGVGPEEGGNVGGNAVSEGVQANLEVELLAAGQAHSLKEALCSFVFWLQAFVLFFGSCGVFLINGNYKTYVKKDISDDEFLTVIGVVGSVGNGCSRFFWNLLFNCTGYKTVMLINLAIQIVIYSAIRFTVSLPGLYLVMVFLMNCCLGGLLVMGPTFAQIVFGARTGSNIYGFYWSVFAIANFVQYAYVSGLTRLIGFNGIIYICLGMSIVSGILVIAGRFQGPWKNPMYHLSYCVNHITE